MAADGVVEFHLVEGGDELAKLVLLECAIVELDRCLELFLVIKHRHYNPLKRIRNFLKLNISLIEP